MDRNGELEGKIDELMCNIEDNLNQIEEGIKIIGEVKKKLEK